MKTIKSKKPKKVRKPKVYFPDPCPFCEKPTKHIDAPGAAHPKCREKALNAGADVILVDCGPGTRRTAFPVDTTRLTISLGKERLYVDVRNLLKDGSPILEINVGGVTRGLVVHPIRTNTLRVSVEKFDEEGGL